MPLLRWVRKHSICSFRFLHCPPLVGAAPSRALLTAYLLYMMIYHKHHLYSPLSSTIGKLTKILSQLNLSGFLSPCPGSARCPSPCGRSPPARAARTRSRCRFCSFCRSDCLQNAVGIQVATLNDLRRQLAQRGGMPSKLHEGAQQVVVCGFAVLALEPLDCHRGVDFKH